MFWKILEIEPTTDKKRITMAYREKLVNTNPEEKPEQFKQLREAYEQALAYAENGGQQVLTPVEKWALELEELYNDFSKRRDLECWKQLLNQSVCQGLDTRIQVEEKLLQFFMKSYFISHEVWLYLDNQFSFIERLGELYEQYPKDFVDYVVVNGINFEDTLPFEFFYPGTNGEDAEAYLSCYIKARNADPEDALPLLQQMNSLSEKHPYGDAMTIIYDINNDNNRIDELQQVVERYHYEHRLALMLANTFFNDNEFEKCENVCRKGLEGFENDTRIMWCLSNALAGQERYKDAIEIIHDLMKQAGGDQRQLEDLNNRRAEWNESLIKKYTEMYKENPNDVSLKLDLAWALLQNDRYDESDEIASTLVLEETEPFAYYNLLSNLDFCKDRIDAGLEKLDQLIIVIQNMKDDGTKKTRKRMARLAEIVSRKGYYLVSANRVEEGFDTYKEAIKIDSNDADILTQLAQLSFRFKKYEDTVSYSREIIRVKPNAYHGYLLLSYGHLMLGNDSEAYDSVNKAIDLYGGDLECYIIKLRLLVRNNAVEASRELLQFLEDNGCGDDLSVMYCKGNIVEFFDKDEKQALDIYKAVVERIEEGQYCSVSDLVYNRYLILYGETKNANKQEDRDEMLEIAEKGLKFNPDHYGLLDYKAWLLMRSGKNEEALKAYFALAEREKHSPEVEFQIGKLYYDDLDANAKLAEEYFLKAFEKGHMGPLFYLAYTYYYMDNLDESERFSMLLREDEQKQGNIDVDSYYRMSYIYEKRKQLDLAIAENEIAIENARKRGSKLESYYNHKVRLLRKANKPLEAIETIRQMIDELKIDYGYDTMTKVYLQFGMYDEAKKLINNRLKDNNDAADAAADLVKLHILTGHMTKAKLQLLNYKAVMDQWTVDGLSKNISDFEMKFEKGLMIELNRLQQNREKGNRIAGNLVRVAECYNDLGNQQKAMEYANYALEAYEKETPEYSTNKAIDQIVLARIYIMLNRFDEAEELMNLARERLCGNCTYGECKDADIFTISLLVKKGLYQQAFEQCQALIEKWKDVEDFVIQLEQIKKLKR